MEGKKERDTRDELMSALARKQRRKAARGLNLACITSLGRGSPQVGSAMALLGLPRRCINFCASCTGTHNSTITNGGGETGAQRWEARVRRPPAPALQFALCDSDTQEENGEQPGTSRSRSQPTFPGVW